MIEVTPEICMFQVPFVEEMYKIFIKTNKCALECMNVSLLLLLLQLSFHSMAVVLTPVQTKQIIYIKEKIQEHSTDNTKHSKYKYTYYQNTHT